MKSRDFLLPLLLIISILPAVASASSIKGTSLGEISGCDYYAIDDSAGDYTIAEWYGGITPYEGDSIIGELHSYGFKDLYDINRNSSTHVWLEDWLLSEDRATEILVDKCGWSSQLKTYFDGGSSYYYAPSYPTYTPAATCPVNSTASGSECYCNTGYRAVGSVCVINTPTCPANASVVGTSCQCNAGYIASGNTCITPSANCQATYGLNSYGDTQNCYCNTGYQWNTAKTSCIISPVITPTTVTLPAIVVTPPKTPAVNNFEVSHSDIDHLSGIATLDTATAFRQCPSTECSIIRYYAETSNVSIVGKYKLGDWYEISGTTDAGGTGKKVIGWIHKSLIGTISIDTLDASTAQDQSTSTSALETATSSEPKHEGFIAHLWNMFLGWFRHSTK